MGRGAQAETRRLADQQLAAQNALNRQIQSQAQALRSAAAGGFRQLASSPGFSEAERAAMRNQSLGALAGAFDALAASAANRRARTRNAAGFGELLDALAREQGRQAASLAQQSELAFAERAREDRLAGLEGLAGLYGVDSTLLARALGIPADLLGVRASASRSGSSGFRFGPFGLSFGG